MSDPKAAAVRLVFGLAALWLLSACSAGGMPVATPTHGDPATDGSAGQSAGASSPSPGWVATSPDPTVRATPSGGPETAAPTDSLQGAVVETIADEGLRVRSEPRVADDSIRLDPLLPLGTQLLVLDGPISASGYVWYEVVPMSQALLPSGWIAIGDRDGVPWVEEAVAVCPPLPDDYDALAALSRGVGLACFPRTPITIEARILSCGCDADGPWYTPSWFFLGSGSPVLLVDPDVEVLTDEGHVGPWFVLNLDPDGDHPAELPLGEVVEITGIYDHPAAATCTLTEWDGSPQPSQQCRLEFAVTRLIPAGR